MRKTMIAYSDFIKPRIFPICIITLCLMLGIWWQSQTYPLSVIVVASSAICCITLVLRRWYLPNTYHLIMLCSIIACAGAFRFQQLVEQQRIFQQITNHNSYDIIGSVVDSVRTGNARLPQRITLKITSLQNEQSNTFPSATLYVYTKRLKGISINDTIVIKQYLFHHNYKTDFNSYLLKENIAATIVLQKHIVQRVYRPPVSLWRWLYYFRKELVDRCRCQLQPITYLYFASIFLGSPETKKMIDPIKQHLQQWGIVHYLARSGLHVVIFIALWQLLLKAIPIRLLLKELILMLLCIIYALLSWPSIPFHRAFFTFIVTRCCTMSCIRVYYLPVLAIVTMATLLINPFFLFSLDFQLSFGITCALAWFNEIQANHRLKS